MTPADFVKLWLSDYEKRSDKWDKKYTGGLFCFQDGIFQEALDAYKESVCKEQREICAENAKFVERLSGINITDKVFTVPIIDRDSILNAPIP